MENNFIEIVRLAVKDWQEYKKIRLDALQNAPQAFGSSYADNREKPDSYWQSRLADAANGNGSWLLFAKENQQLVGMIGAFIEENEPDTASIISVFVTGEARGKKISKMLMSAIITELKNKGIKTAQLTVNTNQLPALNLYKSFGFQVVRIDKQQRMGNGEYVDEFVMEKRLAD